MCGIAGGTGLDSPDRRRVVDAQLACLHHRGPDAAGYRPGARAAVGQTRLAIIDLAAGDPPLTDESGRVRAVLNGEIYNFRQLREELHGQGHRFTSACDTEVVAHLAETLEPVELCRRLDGMFAIAVWDEGRGRLVLGRDRLGKKPLYYWSRDGELVFGSELKAVLADPRVPREIDTSVVPDYLAYGYAPTPRTFYRHVRSLPPGCVLTFVPGGEPTVEPYWTMPVPDADTGLVDADPREVVAETRRLLEAAVAKRLVADVPLGAFLSGGVDSSAVVGLMAGLVEGPVRTFSIGFDEQRFDERSWARLVAERYGTQHEELVASPDATALLEDVLEGCDQPFADSSALPTFLLAKMTRRSVTVALSGDGGDELFAGYERFAAGIALGRAGRLPDGLRQRAGAVAHRMGAPTKVRRMADALGAGLPDGYHRLTMVFSPEDVAALVPTAAHSPLRTYDAVWAASQGAPDLHRLLHLNASTYLLDDLLVKVDRMSMAHGLEVRSPLLDVDLLEFALKVPPGQHLRGRSLKRLLKSAVRDLVPAEVLDRPKKGFGVPLDAWFRGELKDLVHDELTAPAAPLHDVVSREAVVRLVTEHDRGTHEHGQRLWSLLVLARFLQRER